MALKIRLARGGAKKRPFYRVVVAEANCPRDGRFVERIGTYNPMLPQGHADRKVLNTERVKHWLAVGAQPTDRVKLFLVEAGLAEKTEQPLNPKKSAPKKRAQERAKAEEVLAASAKEKAAELAAVKEAAPVQEAAAVEELAIEKVPDEVESLASIAIVEERGATPEVTPDIEEPIVSPAPDETPVIIEEPVAPTAPEETPVVQEPVEPSIAPDEVPVLEEPVKP